LTAHRRAHYARRDGGTSTQRRDADYVRSIERGLAVIAALGIPGQADVAGGVRSG
jgi:hypothetical protein